MSRFQPVDLPASALGLMNFSMETMSIVNGRIEEADRTGCWQHAQPFKIDLNNPEFWAYWIYKSRTVVRREYKDSGVEKALAPFRGIRHRFAPTGWQRERRFTLSAVGDLLKTPGLEDARDHLYAEVADRIFDADIAYANLESTLSHETVPGISLSEGSTPYVNVNAAEYHCLQGHDDQQFDVLQLANNHILDCGETGVNTTLAQLAEDGIFQVGVNTTPEAAQRAQIFEKNGLRIGWVAHTYGVNFKPFPEGKPWLVNMTDFHGSPDFEQMERQMADCRAKGCDVIIVGLHWGLEFELMPHPEQRRLAHYFADLGADAVIGHHPHVPQPLEIYRSEGKPEHAVPIFYSLGNLTPVISAPAAVLSLIARLTIERGSVNGQQTTRIVGVDIDPVVTLRDQGLLTLQPLAALLREDHDAFMVNYLNEAAEVADCVLGADWRQTESTTSAQETA